MELVPTEEPPCESSAEEQKTWDKARFLTLTGLAAALFSSYASVYILASFYPPLAEEKGVSGIEIGLVIGIIQGIFIFPAYLFVQFTHVISPPRQVILGLVITGVCTLIFSCLDKVPDGTPFFVACFCMRILQGIGIAASDLCAIIIANEVIPHNLLGTVVGILEFSVYISIAVAPAIGGYLFEAGGFYLPFVVSGVSSLAAGVFCFFALPTSVGEFKKQNLRQILKHSVSLDMLVYLTQFTLGGVFSGFFAGMIEPHLRQFDLQPGQLGLVILITTAVSGLTFPVWGLLVDKLRAATSVALIGCILSALGFVLFGPFPHLSIELLACNNEELANSVLASGYPSTFNTGVFLGAVLGGTFVDWIGFRTGCAVLFGLQLFGAATFLLLLARNGIRNYLNSYRRKNISIQKL